MKPLITFTIMAIIIVAGLLAVYNPPVDPVPVLQVEQLGEARPVILQLNEQSALAFQTIATFDSQRVAYDPAVEQEGYRRALIDRGKIPNPYKRSHNFD